MRAWLREHSLREHASQFRARAEYEEFDIHPSELGRLVSRPDVLATGISAADEVDLLGAASAAEVYAPAGKRSEIFDEHALAPRAGPLRIRWVLDEVWTPLERDRGRRAPRAAILLDLLESDETRARREAARVLGP
jgi:hypothetical protein